MAIYIFMQMSTYLSFKKSILNLMFVEKVPLHQFHTALSDTQR